MIQNWNWMDYSRFLSKLLILSTDQMDTARRWIHQLKQLNFFLDAKTKQEGNPQVLRDQVLSTRVYICLMVIGTFTLVVSAFAAPRTISVTVERPSIDRYYDLEVQYPNTLACPCKNTAVPYGSFLSIIPIYHQVIFTVATSSVVLSLISWCSRSTNADFSPRYVFEKFGVSMNRVSRDSTLHWHIEASEGYSHWIPLDEHEKHLLCQDLSVCRNSRCTERETKYIKILQDSSPIRSLMRSWKINIYSL